MSNKTRSEHLQWCKDRARLEEEPNNQMSSFISDMSKHEDTSNHKALEMFMPMLMTGSLVGSGMMKFIDGFN